MKKLLQNRVWRQSALSLLLCVFVAGCSARNLDDVKAHAKGVWEANGYRVRGYEGYQWGGPILAGPYGGAKVWYIVEKLQPDGITYHGFLQRWGDEYHVYELKALDAIAPNP